MILQIVAIRDRAADAFQQPWFVHTIGQAIRAFGDEINRKDSPAGQHPDDYDLYHLGSYDDFEGHLTNNEGGPKQIAIGKNLATGS